MDRRQNETRVKTWSFFQVAREEVSTFVDAFFNIGQGKYKPSLTLIAVSKDHNERLYPMVSLKL